MPSEGVRRIASNDEFLEFCSSVHDNCIDHIEYARIKEFYLDTPYQLLGDTLWFLPKYHCGNGSAFKLAYVAADYITYNFFSWVTTVDGTEYYECMIWYDNPSFPLLTPITSPLPDWEIPLLDTLIPMPTKPDSPDPGDPEDPNNPNDPNNPDNPGDPNDPEDPEGPQDPEGIDNIQNSTFKINIAPNPADSRTTISCDLPITELTLCDLAGRPLTTLRNCGTSASLDLSTFPQGLYLIKVKTSAGTTVRKLSVQ